MPADPTQFDFHAAAALARFLGRYPLFDHAVDSALHHHLLGGIPFAAAFFYFWVQAEHEHRQDDLRRLITVILGSLAAIALCIVSAKFISWLPPQRLPGLEHFYPSYLLADPNTNSFPSDSTALCTSIAIGIFSLNRLTGAVLLAAVPLIVSLPRMYLGGHYPADVLAGLLIGLVAYWIARIAFERTLSAGIISIGSQPGWPRILLETCIFLWILEVAVSFQEGVWILNTLHYFHLR
jgi:membrane-associated phospholipid phosphatase